MTGPECSLLPGCSTIPVGAWTDQPQLPAAHPATPAAHPSAPRRPAAHRATPAAHPSAPRQPAAHPATPAAHPSAPRQPAAHPATPAAHFGSTPAGGPPGDSGGVDGAWAAAVSAGRLCCVCPSPQGQRVCLGPHVGLTGGRVRRCTRRRGTDRRRLVGNRFEHVGWQRGGKVAACGFVATRVVRRRQVDSEEHVRDDLQWSRKRPGCRGHDPTCADGAHDGSAGDPFAHGWMQLALTRSPPGEDLFAHRKAATADGSPRSSLCWAALRKVATHSASRCASSGALASTGCPSRIRSMSSSGRSGSLSRRRGMSSGIPTKGASPLTGSRPPLSAVRSTSQQAAGDLDAKGRGRHQASCPVAEQCRQSRVPRSRAAISPPLARAEASVPEQAPVCRFVIFVVFRYISRVVPVAVDLLGVSEQDRGPASLLPSLINDLVPGDRRSRPETLARRPQSGTARG